MILGIQFKKLRFWVIMTDNFSIDSILSSKNEIETGQFIEIQQFLITQKGPSGSTASPLSNRDRLHYK